MKPQYYEMLEVVTLAREDGGGKITRAALTSPHENETKVLNAENVSDYDRFIQDPVLWALSNGWEPKSSQCHEFSATSEEDGSVVRLSRTTRLFAKPTFTVARRLLTTSKEFN